MLCPPQSGFQLEEAFSSASSASWNIKPLETSFTASENDLFSEVNDWNNRLALVKNQFLLFGEGAV